MFANSSESSQNQIAYFFVETLNGSHYIFELDYARPIYFGICTLNYKVKTHQI
jgi:hypothetical protein